MGIFNKSLKAIFATISAIILVTLGATILIFGAPLFAILITLGGCILGVVIITHGIYTGIRDR